MHRSALSAVICAQQAGAACTSLPWILLNSVNIIEGISVTWSVSQTPATLFCSDCNRRLHTRMKEVMEVADRVFLTGPGCRHDGLRRSLHLDIAQSAKGKP